jgi:uncharacterized protein (TIGR03437 family)
MPLVAQTLSPVPPRITQAVDDTKLVTFQGNTHPLARTEYDQGAVPRDLPMERMLLLLSRGPEQEAALQQLLAEQQDPNSANYRRWLTPAQFGDQFGPAPEDIERITSWLTSQGFQVAGVADGRVAVEFSGTAAQVEQALHTPIHSYLVNGEQHFANAQDPQIPAALSSVVAGIVSLHNFPMKSMHHTTGAFRKEPGGGWVPAGLAPQYTVPWNGLSLYAVAPADFATIYNLQPLWSAGIDGTGQTIAIVGRSNIVVQDVRNFRSAFGLPAHDPIVTLTGADPGTAIADDESENVLDVEWSGAVARGATINLVVSASTATDGATLSSNYIVEKNLAPVLSSSFGVCELFGVSQNQYYNNLWQQAAAQGITVVVASGDGGSGLCEERAEYAQSGVAVNGVASTPYNVAVGGTDFSDVLSGTESVYWSSFNTAGTLASALSYIPEMTWNDTCASPQVLSFFGPQVGSSTAEALCNTPHTQSPSVLTVDGGSGGASSLYPKPSWQSGVNGIPTDNQRDLPDVSLFSGDDSLWLHAYTFCQSDQQGACSSSSPGGFATMLGYGDSYGAPEFAGIMALVNQKTGSRQGLANPALYSLASVEYGSPTSPNTASLQACNSSASPASSSSCVFHDVTVGDNSVPCLKGTPNCYVFSASDRYGILSTSTTSLVPAYQAGPGYDLATGLGSVNITNLVNKWPGGNSHLSIGKTHIGNFAQGQSNATYTVAVSNGVSAGPTNGMVTVTETAPAALTVVSMTGTGWTCSANTCRRSDALAAGSIYPAIAVTVNVASNAPSQVTNQVTVSGGNSASATANDVTTIVPCCTISTTTTAAASPSSVATTGSATLTATVAAASGSGTPTGAVTFNLGSTQLGSATLTGSGGSALATLVVTGSELGVGSYSIAANYSGDANFNGSSASVTFVVTPPPSLGYVISTVAGNGTSGFSGDGGPATSAEFQQPWAIAVDSADNLFIADYQNNRVRKVTPAGIISTVAGNGNLGFSGDGGPATSAKLASPSGVAVDGTGNLFIADYGNNRIRKVTPAGTISTVAGSGLNLGDTGDGGPATSAELDYPAGVAVDGAGNLFFAESTRIRKVTAAGIISTVAGNGTQGFSGDGGPATSAELDQPNAIAVDSAGNLFIADWENNRIRKVTPAGIISTVAGNGPLFPSGGGFSGDGGPATLAVLNEPESVAVDSAGNLFIADGDNSRVRRVTSAGTISTVAGNGSWGFGGDGGPAALAEVQWPSGVALDSAGNLFIVDSTYRVRKLTPMTSSLTVSKSHSGTFSLAQTGATYTVSVGNLASSGPTNGPVTVTENPPTGLTLVSMAGPGWACASVTCTRSDVLSPGSSYPAITVTVNVAPDAPSQVINQVTVSGGGSVSSAANDTTNIGSGPGTLTTIALTASPNMIAPTGSTTLNASLGAIVNVAPTGTVTFYLGSSLLGSATVTSAGGTAQATLIVPASQLALGANSITADYTGDANYARSWASVTVTVTPQSGYIINTVAGNGNSGFTGDGQTATQAELNWPSGVAVDGSGNLFIADFLNNRVRKVTAAGTISTVAGNGSNGFSGDGGPAASAELAAPCGVALDGAGNLFIADYGNSRIRKVTPAGIISTVAGNGTAAYRGDGGPATSAELGRPQGVVVDGAGNLYIADTANSRIRKVTAGGTISTVAGDGDGSFGGNSGDGGPATSAQLNTPSGIALDSSGNLFIAEWGNNRIRKVTPAGTISTVAGTGTAGSSGNGGQATSAQLSSPWGVAVDSSGNLFITDNGNARIQLVTPGGTISTVAGTGTPGFSGDGGPGIFAQLADPEGIAVDGSGNIFTTDGVRIREASPATAPSISPGGLISAASNLGGPVSPGEIVAIYGTALGPANPAFTTLDSTGKVSTSTGGVTVSFNGVAAPLTYVSSTQIDAIVPYEIAGSSSLSVQVTYQQQASSQLSLQIATAAPALFTQNSSGTGPGAILNGNNQLNTQQSPAAKGSVIELFMTGEGLTIPAQATGAVTAVNTTGAGPVTPAPQQAVSVTIGGQPAHLEFAGEAPGAVAGVLQVNADVPAGIGSGAVPITVQIGTHISQSGVTVWVQ